MSFVESESGQEPKPLREAAELQHDLNLAHESYLSVSQTLLETQNKLAVSESKRRNQRKQLRSYQKLWSMYVKGTHDGMFHPEEDTTA